MSFDNPNEPTVLSVKAVTHVEVIDGGDTVALRVGRADGQPSAILLPRDVARVMAETLREKVAEATARAAGSQKR